MSDTISLPPDSPLREIVDRSPALVVFLRHFGCTFCREALADVAALRPEIEATETRIAFVHPESPEVARTWFDRYGLSDVVHVSDPSLAHYRAFGLGNTRPSAIVDPKVWARGASSALAHGFGFQPPSLLRQLAGVFVVRGDRLLASFRHRTAADRPDYLELLRTGRGQDVTLSRVVTGS